ncbi:MAG: vitamin B12-dependent ribonucleotide reductase [Candidatus Sumerlaeaceae bacterium]|nr:vitamin B12-dependent ribonucleotide reductase [Candidatus Sumerlaeaceae bacterium]
MTVLTEKIASGGPGKAVEPAFSANAVTVLNKRYLKKNDAGELVETPAELVWRVAANIAQAELNFPASRDRYEEVCKKYYDLMASCEFMPNSPTLMNAGKGRPQQLSACFVIPVEDAIDSIFDAVKHAAIIHKTGGGTGFAFSRLRPKNDRVRSTKGVSSGPVSFMKVFNSATEAIKQGGTRRGANMGILRVDHPDILEFIECKADMVSVTNFNISVALTEKFMEAVLANEDYELYNPKNGQPVGKLNAAEVFNRMVDNAWKNGDPGLVFIDRINRDNPTPQVGPMESTNPCGEQPLLPYEACNLGSVNLALMTKRIQVCEQPSGASTSSCDGYTSRNLLNDGTCWVIDWDKLAETVHLCIRFLDDVIEMSDFPLPSITNIVKVGNRKIGLGVMGFADLLFLLGIPYSSKEAVELGERLMAFIQSEAGKASEALAKERGPFGHFQGSVFCDESHPWYNGCVPRRNATVTTIAPTGTISIIAGCSSGIEPLFAISFYRKVLDGAELVDIHPYFEQVARARGFYSETLMKEIAMRGSVQEMEDVPQDVRDVFITAHDVTPKWHLEHQAAFQRHCENAVSKTVNFPNHATREDVAEVYKLAYLKGCKGVTIYRDGSRDVQVLNIGTGSKKAEDKITAGNGHKPEIKEPKPVQTNIAASRAAVTLSAGGARIAVKSGHQHGAASNGTNRLMRRFSLDLDRSNLEQVAALPHLFLSDGNGLRIPLNLVSQEGHVGHGLQMVIEAAPTGTAETKQVTALKCPECGAPLAMEEGCRKCHACGFSKCG